MELRITRGFTAPYIVHQLVADLVPDREGRGYLYRVTNHGQREVEALVLSEEPPVPAPPERPWGTTVRHRSKPFDPQLGEGTVLDFEIRLNATRTVTYQEITHGTKTKKRCDVWDAVLEGDRDDPRSPHDVYRSYLERKLDACAEIREARLTERGQVRARRADRKRPILFVATNLVGTLRVTEPDAFRSTLALGIGRAKAFGCGLLCLSRPGTVLARRRSGGGLCP